MDINTGIDSGSREKMANALAELLANTYTLYLKTHAYHWNVEGPHFQALHTQFMDQYTEMWTAVDEIAERIRALGHYAPGSYAAFAKLSSIAETTDVPSWQDMVKSLGKGHEAVAKNAREVLRIAEEIGDDATSDVIAPRVTLHEKTAWMLRATAA